MGRDTKRTEELNSKEARGIEVSNHQQSEEDEDKMGDQEKIFVDTAWESQEFNLQAQSNTDPADCQLK